MLTKRRRMDVCWQSQASQWSKCQQSESLPWYFLSLQTSDSTYRLYTVGQINLLYYKIYLLLPLTGPMKYTLQWMMMLRLSLPGWQVFLDKGPVSKSHQDWKLLLDTWGDQPVPIAVWPVCSPSQSAHSTKPRHLLQEHDPVGPIILRTRMRCKLKVDSRCYSIDNKYIIKKFLTFSHLIHCFL